MAQSTKPSGLKITRKNSKFTASWKIPKGGYDDGQNADYNINQGAWKDLTNAKTANKKTFTIDLSDYYPSDNKTTKIKKVSVRVQGNSKGASTVSDWSVKSFEIEEPKKPSVSTSTGEYSTSFKWLVHDKDNDKFWFSKVEWESVLYRDSSETGGKNISFKADKNAKGQGYVSGTKLSGSSTKSDFSKTITEDGGILGDGHSYTRWFRIKALGPAGDSEWVYEKHTYALPTVATIDGNKTKVSKSRDELNYKCNVFFNTNIGIKRPAEKVEIKYLMTVPGLGLSCPSGASWTTAATPVINKNINDKEKYSKVVDNSGGTTFYIGDTLDPDQCLFFRADVTHDTKTTPGKPYLARINDVPGVMYDPEDLDVQANVSEHTAIVSATNKSQVPDSRLAVTYEDTRTNTIQYLGIIDHNESSTIIKYPETDQSPNFGVMAFAGEVTEGSGQYWMTNDTTVQSGKVYYEAVLLDTDVVYEGKANVFPYLGPYTETLSHVLEFTPLRGTILDFSIVLGETGTTVHVSFNAGESASRMAHFAYNDTATLIEITYDGNKTFSDIQAVSKINSSEKLTVSVSYNTKYPDEGSFTGIYNPVKNIASGANPKALGYYETYDVPTYSIDPIMKSNVIWKGGEIITAPKNIKAERYDQIPGTIRVTWDWSWNEANAIELSWADHIDAWESTDQPSTYNVTKLYSSSWNISGLETGKEWYVRGRYMAGLGEASSFGMYSDIITVDLKSAPLTPTITLTPSTITEDGETTASWVYSTTDGTRQASAELVEVITNDVTGEREYKQINNAQILTAQYYTISAADQEWHAGETHDIAVKVMSESGMASDYYSDPDTVTVAERATCIISDTSLEKYTEHTTDEQGQDVYEVVDALRDMPITVKVISGYEASTDTSVDSSKTYYSRTDTKEYEYEAIIDPQGNPKEQGWYELNNGNYILTNDEEVSVSKSYFVRNGDPEYVYSSIANPSGNPSESNYYEEVLVDEGNKITLVISRAESYDVDRPDETHYGVFEDETVTLLYRHEKGLFTITNDDLIGNLDDGARYNLTATVQDGLGQTSEPSVIEFTVHWAHQAVPPTVSVSILQEEAIAVLTPIAPAEQEDILHYDTKAMFPASGTDGKIYISDDNGTLYRWDGSEYVENTDVCDIYRLSVDKPELIYKGAEFGTTYVDPYPTIGEYGGHRFVTRTINGDYITGDAVKGDFAWTNTSKEDGDIFETHSNIIDFAYGRAYVLYEVGISNSWSKDFKETKYLGGHVQGDWNRGVTRTGSINVTAVSDYDQDLVRTMRELAAYPGICHVRSKDGSSYSADVQINETYEYTRAPRFNKYSLSITRIDSETYDGMTYEEWEESHNQES